MPPEPSWKNCKDCCEARLPYPTEEIREIIRRENLTTGGGLRELEGTINLSTLCDKCIKITPCSVCKEIVLTQKEGCNRLEISNWNKEPICAECKKTQCYRCGNYNNNDCDGNCDGCDCDQLKTWWGWVMCEDCGMELCNVCRGECEHPCSSCEKPCDADCGCSEGSGSEDDSSINENERPKNSIEEPEVCTTCNSPLDWYKGYYGKWSKCSNQCVKCEKGCYKFCECSKRIVECKECKFCDILIPLKNEICSELFDEGCCTICKGDCYYVCEECKNNCDTECECQITCISCENKFPRNDFISEDSENRSQSYNSHGQAVGKAEPICCDCQSQWCWCDEGPCPTPCTTCHTTCDECCGCECEECGETTEQGGCKCYSEEYINMKKKLKEGTPDRNGGTWICKSCENMKPAAVKKQRQKKMSVQYVYGLENEALPGIVKIAGCKAEPTMYLNEALAMPTPLSLPFVWRLVNSKRVSDLQKKLDSLYALIEKKRIGNSDCFRISAEEFNKILDVIDEDSVSTEKRDMRKAFKDKQVVRHSIGGNTWSGIYDLAKNVIIYNNISYKSPSGFAKAHYSDVKSDRTTANGWVECQIEKEGVWVPIA